jgi:hypothetical protein
MPGQDLDATFSRDFLLTVVTHFPSVEEPEPLGRDIAAFFDELGTASSYPFDH